MRLPDLHPKQEFGSRIDNLLVQKIVSIRIIKRSRASLRLILLITGILSFYEYSSKDTQY